MRGHVCYEKVDDFLADVEPGLSAEERHQRAATLDPKLISPAYEAELKKNVVRAPWFADRLSFENLIFPPSGGARVATCA